MTIRYRSTPQVRYGNSGSHFDIASRFPPEARPIGTAPENLTTPIVVAGPNGQGFLAVPTRLGWERARAFKDTRGNVSYRATGVRIAQPVMWWPPRPGRG